MGEHVPKKVRYRAHGLPCSDTAAEIIMRTRLRLLGVEAIEQGFVDVVHLALFSLPVSPHQEEVGLFRTTFRHWRN